jgi:hypothetical protein
MRLRNSICVLACLMATCVFTHPQGSAAPHNPAQPPQPLASEQSQSEQPQISDHKREQKAPPEGGATGNVLKEPASTVVQQEQKVPEAASSTLTRHEKFDHWIHRAYSPYTFGGAVFDATWAQMWGDWAQYGGGMQGWGKRYGATLADTETRTFFGQFLFPVMFKQDPRYFSSQKKGLVPRAWYAGTRVLITRRDGDGNTVNTSEFAAVMATAAVQNAYYPRRDKGFTETMNRFVGGLGSDATSNLLREFWPDIKRVFRKHEPESLKKLEKRMPASVSRLAGQM